MNTDILKRAIEREEQMMYNCYMLIIIFSLIILLFSIAIHEVSHGQVAYYLGDPTAKYAGRLTLNPIKHLDPFGSIILPLFLVIMRSPFIIGWAKPVPINPYNFKNPKWDNVKVAIAGPGANLFIALFFGSLVRFFPLLSALLPLFSLIIGYNLLLAIFNLVPIPPLDGSHILFNLLPERAYQVKKFLRQYGTLLLLLFLFFGINLLDPLISFLYQLITGQAFILF